MPTGIPGSMPSHLLAYIEEHPGCTADELALGIAQEDTQNVRKCLWRLRSRSLVVSVKPAKGGMLCWYLQEHVQEDAELPAALAPVIRKRKQKELPPLVWVHPIRARALGLLSSHHGQRVSA